MHLDQMRRRSICASSYTTVRASALCQSRNGETDRADVTLVAGQTVTCVGPRFEWYPLAVRDEAFFHAVMSSTSSHAAYRQGVDLPRNFFFHRGEAIRLLNEKISSGMYDEGTINTVAVFVQQEVRLLLCWQCIL
jgi:hypothetical protein